MHSCIRIGLLVALFTSIFSGFSTAQTRPEPLPPLDSLTVEEMKQISGKIFGTAFSLDSLLKERAMLENAAQGLALNQAALAKMDSTVSKQQIDTLNKVAKLAVDSHKKTADLAGKAGKLLRFIEPYQEMDSLSLRKNIPKAWKQLRQIYDQLYPAPPSGNPEMGALADQEPKPDKEKKKKETKSPEPPPGGTEPVATVPVNPASNPSKRFVAYNPANDVMLRPPTPPCNIATSSRDEFSGEISREMARAEFFRYTNPALKTYLQGKTHVICEAALASSGTKASLLLTFKINDPNARKAFGRLEKNSIATLKFLDGSTFELQNAIADEGVFNPENDASIFHAHYPLNPEALKKIRRTGVDKLRILWSKGYDDYDVQQVDLLMRQAECLFK